MRPKCQACSMWRFPKPWPSEHPPFCTSTVIYVCAKRSFYQAFVWIISCIHMTWIILNNIESTVYLQSYLLFINIIIMICVMRCLLVSSGQFGAAVNNEFRQWQWKQSAEISLTVIDMFFRHQWSHEGMELTFVMRYCIIGLWIDCLHKPAMRFSWLCIALLESFAYVRCSWSKNAQNSQRALVLQETKTVRHAQEKKASLSTVSGIFLCTDTDIRYSRYCKKQIQYFRRISTQCNSQRVCIVVATPLWMAAVCLVPLLSQP